MKFGSNSRSLGCGTSRAGHAGGIAALSTALALLVAQAVAPPTVAESGNNDDPLEAVNLGVAVLEQLDQLVIDTRQAIARGGPTDTGFARVISDVDAVYQATLGRVTGFEEFAFTLDFALIGGQILDLTNNPAALLQSDLAEGDLLIGTMLNGDVLELDVLEAVTDWVDFVAFMLDEQFGNLDLEEIWIAEDMAEFVPRVSVVRADVLGQNGVAEDIILLLGERHLPEHPSHEIVAWPIGKSREGMEFVTIVMTSEPICLGMNCHILKPVILPAIVGGATIIAAIVVTADCISGHIGCKNKTQGKYERCVGDCEGKCKFQGSNGQQIISWGCYTRCAGCCWATAHQDKKNCGVCGSTEPAQSGYDYCVQNAWNPPAGYPKKPRSFDGGPLEWPNP